MNKPDIQINNKIHTIRGVQVMLDSDLAELYDVPVKRLNEQVRRNSERFPEHFMFQLSVNEYFSLRSHFATLNPNRGQHRKYIPFAFTESGVAMLSAVLKSKKQLRSASRLSLPSLKCAVSLSTMLKFLRSFTKLIRNFWSTTKTSASCLMPWSKRS